MTFAEFWTSYLWPLIVIVAESLLLLVLLLVVDRLCAARRPQDLGGGADPARPERGRALGAAAVLRRPVEIRVQGAGHPGGRQQGRVPAGAAGDLHAWRSAAWAVIPVNAGWVIADINVGVLYIFAISSLMVYGIIMAGWASNSKYAFLAAVRSAAQMVSYEVSIGFVIITVLLCAGSLKLSGIVAAQDTRFGHVRLVLAAAVADVRRVLSSRRWPRPTGRRSIWSRRNRNWSPASWSNTARRPT